MASNPFQRTLASTDKQSSKWIGSPTVPGATRGYPSSPVQNPATPTVNQNAPLPDLRNLELPNLPIYNANPGSSLGAWVGVPSQEMRSQVDRTTADGGVFGAPVNPQITPAVPLQQTQPMAAATQGEQWGGNASVYNPPTVFGPVPASEIAADIAASSGAFSMPTLSQVGSFIFPGTPTTPVTGTPGGTTDPGLNPTSPGTGWAQDRATAEDHLIGWANRPPGPDPWVETNFAASNQGNWLPYEQWGADANSDAFRRFESGLRVNDPTYADYLRFLIQYDPAVANSVPSNLLYQFGLMDLYEAKRQAELAQMVSSSQPFLNPQVMPYQPPATVPGSSRGYP